MANITIEDIAGVLKKIDDPAKVERELSGWKEFWLPRKFRFRDYFKGIVGDGRIQYCGSILINTYANENGAVIKPIDVFNNTSQHDEKSILPVNLRGVPERIADTQGINYSGDFSIQVPYDSSVSHFEKQLFSVINARKELDTRLSRYLTESVDKL